MGYSICLKLSEEEFKEKYGTPTNTLFTREILEQSLLTVVMKTEVDIDNIFNLNTNILKFNMFVDDCVRQLKDIWRKWIIGLINDDTFLTKRERYSSADGNTLILITEVDQVPKRV